MSLFHFVRKKALFPGENSIWKQQLDAYSEEIIGWSVGPTLDTDYPMAALNMALGRIEGKASRPIHHSDRGCQYASREYVDALRSHGVRISMTECGDPRDNAQAERINNTMKNELLKDKLFTSIEGVTSAVAAAIDFYNNRRPHMSVGMMTPKEASKTSGRRDMKWRSYRHEAIATALSFKTFVAFQECCYFIADFRAHFSHAT